MTKTEIIDTLHHSMNYLRELGYSFKEYDYGPEYEGVFESRERNRKIQFYFSAILGQPFYCRISRPYGILFSLFYYSRLRPFSFEIHDMFNTNDKVKKMTRMTDTHQDLANFRLYDEFFRTKLSDVVLGKQWFFIK